MLDSHVVDTDTPFYGRRTLVGILASDVVVEKQLYSTAVEDRHENFTPFVLTVDGLLHHEVQHFLNCLSTYLADK